MKELQAFYDNAKAGDERYRILDVREAISNGAVAVELKDEAYLRQKIDEIAQAFDTENQGLAFANQSNGSQTASSYTQYQGDVNFSYPSDWLPVSKSSATMQQVKDMFADKSNMAAVTVYQFDGLNDPQAA